MQHQETLIKVYGKKMTKRESGRDDKRENDDIDDKEEGTMQ